MKNSFLIGDGRIGTTLSETMISGNAAQMLHSIGAFSRETLDSGEWLLPWMRVAGLRFS